MRTTNKKTKKGKRFNGGKVSTTGGKVSTTGGKVSTTGGKVITSGGFGCLFKPALKCKNTHNSDVTDKKMVTKLMTVSHAEDEYKQINEFKAILDHIPNYQNYFLVDGFSLCEPSKLTKEDLEGFDKKCDALKKKDLNEKNINQNLDKILALNMPDGGIDVDAYVFSITESKDIAPLYTELNNSLIDLLVNGIVPMNKSQLYHCDVKGSNILVAKDGHNSILTRLIDWGLSVYKKNAEVNHGIPDKLDRRPFQFNVPFSVILFNNKFLKKYQQFLKKHPNSDYFAIREFAINYIFYWNKERGAGHLKTINSIVRHLSYGELFAIENKKVKDHVIEYEFTYYYIVEYISKILFKYTNNSKLNLLEYFNQIFLKNIDIWGLTMLYMVFLDHQQELFDWDMINEIHDEFIQKIKYIIIHFLFETPTEVININDLASELQSLNSLIANFYKPNKLKESVNYFASLKKIDTTDIKEIGGKIHKRTIKKRRSNTKQTKRL